jgi:hypothetical protein
MPEWCALASDAEQHFVQVSALGWLVPFSHLEDADSPFLRNVGIQQLADSDASIYQLMNRYVHTF